MLKYLWRKIRYNPSIPLSQVVFYMLLPLVAFIFTSYIQYVWQLHLVDRVMAEKAQQIELADKLVAHSYSAVFSDAIWLFDTEVLTFGVRQLLFFGRKTQQKLELQNLLSPQMAYMLDAKYDDGYPLSGNIQATFASGLSIDEHNNDCIVFRRMSGKFEYYNYIENGCVMKFIISNRDTDPVEEKLRKGKNKRK